MMDIPDGFSQLKDVSIYTNGTDIVLTGTPPPEEVGETAHDCDSLGCGWEHVIARGAIEHWDNRDWRIKELDIQ